METEVNPLPIVWQDDSNYEECRTKRLFNLRYPNRYPLAIVNASDESHIIATVKLAAEKKCRVSVRAGGHSWAAWSVRDEAILLDLGAYHCLDLDIQTGIVRASPSTRSGDLNSYLNSHGRMFAGGHCADTGIGGFLLQGGGSWNMRGWGWACEQIVALDVVTADGRLIRADTEQNSDLLWAARGCGPGFPGIVTMFHLQTRPAPKIMLSSTYVYPVDKYESVTEWMLNFMPDLDDDTEAVLIAAYPPGVDEICIIAAFITWKMTEDAAKEALRLPEDSFPPDPIVHVFANPTNWKNEYATQEHVNPPNHRYQCDNVFLADKEHLLAAMSRVWKTIPSKETYAFWLPLAMRNPRTVPDMAHSIATDHYFAVYTIWKDERDDQKCITWLADAMKAITPYSRGSYTGDYDFQVRQTMHWDEKQGNQLKEIRQKWDSQGRFCGYLDRGDKSSVNGLPNILSDSTL